MIGWALYLCVGAVLGIVILTTFPEDEQGPYFFVLPGIMPILWGPLLLVFFLGRWF